MTKINVNGKDCELKDVPGETPLLWVLRDYLGLTGLLCHLGGRRWEVESRHH